MADKKAIVIGCGFSGMSCASFLAKSGWQVTILEKHNTPGGRARQFTEQGFTFDMGPSWYWMPDVFERYFKQFGKNVSDFYSLKRLNPSYRIYWPEGFSDIPADMEGLNKLFESIEKGSSAQLKLFLDEAAYKYETGINKLVFKPGQSILEFADMDVIKGVFKLDVFSNMRTHVSKYFRNPKLQYLMEFPVLFLGALAKDTPALYSLMNYADIVGGTWWPQNGMYSIVKAMYEVAKSQNVIFLFGKNVKKIEVVNKSAHQVLCDNGETFEADIVVSSADYHFTETVLLDKEFRNYSEKYWDNRKMAPSSLLYYVGLNKKIKNILHHSLFFDVDFEQHASEIYVSKSWPKEPLFYASATSVSDLNMAPEGCENLFLLVPVAAGLTEDTEELRNKYFEQIVKRMEEHLKEPILEHVIYKKSFAVADFKTEYNSFKGNAYGLANVLTQTANLKPNMRNRKVENLFYTGQLTIPGPGVPPSLISGEVVANYINNKFLKKY